MSNLVLDAITAGTPIYPDVAVNTNGTDNNITDAQSGLANVSTSLVSGVPASGWPGDGIPRFNDFNRLFRIITQWTRFFFAGGWHSAATFYGHGEGVGGTTPVKIALSSINSALTKANCMIISCMVFQEDGQTWEVVAALLTTVAAVDYLEIPWSVGTSGCTYKFIVKNVS